MTAEIVNILLTLEDSFNFIGAFADAAVGAKALRQKTQAELNREGKGGKISSMTSYAIQNVFGLDKPYRVRFNAYFDAKSSCTLFDAEIAGRRTLVCYREGRYQNPVVMSSGKWRVVWPPMNGR